MDKETRKKLEEKFGKPCIEVKSKINDIPELTPELIQEAVDCINRIAEIIRRNTPIISQTPSTAFRRGVVRNFIDVIEITAEYAASHENIVNESIDVIQWLDAIRNMREAVKLVSPSEKLLVSIDALERADSNIIFTNFSRFYHCVKILAADGVPDAMAIWPTMKEVWDHLRGRRGPLCPVKEIENAVALANDVIEKNEPRLLEILNDKKLLAQNLAHAIHQEDTIEDEGLKNIHKFSKDND